MRMLKDEKDQARRNIETWHDQGVEDREQVLVTAAVG